MASIFNKWHLFQEDEPQRADTFYREEAIKHIFNNYDFISGVSFDMHKNCVVVNVKLVISNETYKALNSQKDD